MHNVSIVYAKDPKIAIIVSVVTNNDDTSYQSLITNWTFSEICCFLMMQRRAREIYMHMHEKTWHMCTRSELAGKCSQQLGEADQRDCSYSFSCVPKFSSQTNPCKKVQWLKTTTEILTINSVVEKLLGVVGMSARSVGTSMRGAKTSIRGARTSIRGAGTSLRGVGTSIRGAGTSESLGSHWH